MILNYDLEDDYIEYEPSSAEIGNALLSIYGAQELVNIYINNYYPNIDNRERKEIEDEFKVFDKRDVEIASRDTIFFEDVILETLIDNEYDFEEELKDYFFDIALENGISQRAYEDEVNELNREYYNSRF